MAEQSFDNNAAICELIYSLQSAWIGNCILTRPSARNVEAKIRPAKTVNNTKTKFSKMKIHRFSSIAENTKMSAGSEPQNLTYEAENIYSSNFTENQNLINNNTLLKNSHLAVNNTINQSVEIQLQTSEEHFYNESNLAFLTANDSFDLSNKITESVKLMEESSMTFQNNSDTNLRSKKPNLEKTDNSTYEYFLNVP